MTDFIISTENGKVRGKVCKDYHGGVFYSFSGIPYATAPIGELRFKAPQPVEPWDNIKDGTKEGWEAPSMDLLFGFHLGKENNCLNLNIYAKKLPENGNNLKMPVMVFIHGGGFLHGSNSRNLAGPEYLLTEGIVLVVLNYRLGVLGFLSLEDKTLDVPGNAGLKDQVMALKWIQRNIHHFGGDTNNVTIFGQSSGGASCHYLTLSPLTEGLFHKVIMQSGCALNPWARGRRNGSDIAKAMGYDSSLDEKTILQKLCKASTRSLINGQSKIEDSFFASLARPFGPVIEYEHEGAFITQDPEVIMKSGKYHQIPTIIGYNSLEGLMYELMRKIRSDAKLPDNVEKDIPHELGIPGNSDEAKEIGLRIMQYYYRGEDITEDNINIRYKMFGDIHYVHGIQKTIKLLKHSSKSPVYFYRMNQTSSLNIFKEFCEARYPKITMFCNLLMKLLGDSRMKSILHNLREKLPMRQIDGVSHSDELPYIFNSLVSPIIVKGSAEDISVQRFVKLWTNFAEHGDPTFQSTGNNNCTKWTPVSDYSVNNVLEINDELKMIENVDRDRVQFWENLYMQYR